MNEHDNAAATAEVLKKAQIAQQIKNTEAVKHYAQTARRLISNAPFDGADAPEVAEVLVWLDTTITGSDKALVLLKMESEGKLQTVPAPIKPEVIDNGK